MLKRAPEAAGTLFHCPPLWTPAPAPQRPPCTPKRQAGPLSSVDSSIKTTMIPGPTTHFPQVQKQLVVGSASCLGCLRCPTASPLLILLAILEPAHNAGEVQASRQCVQEHLVLLHALNELLQGEFPWGREKRSHGEEGVQLSLVLYQGTELASCKGDRAHTRGSVWQGESAKEPETEVQCRDS